ncbi:MAG: NAD-dependent epimerase/dehydratase family protein, partial [Candidatus Binatia bacterium]
LKEEALLVGATGPDVEGYATASRLLVSLLRGYSRQYGLRAGLLILTNVYGPGMSDDPEHSFVVPAMIRRLFEAVATGDDRVICWGSGRATRDFLYVEDAARAIVDATRHVEDPEPINIGSGIETSIAELARSVADLAGYEGTIEWDSNRPEGVLRRALDITRARELIGFEPSVDLAGGLRRTLAGG